MCSSSDNDMALVGGFGAGLYLFFKGFRIFRKYRVLADTPEMPIRSIPMGLVEVHGKAGEPPYVVRFDDGHTGLVFPGPDAVIEHPGRAGGGQKAGPGRKSGGAGAATPRWPAPKRTGG